jgi:hypothetical protein
MATSKEDKGKDRAQFNPDAQLTLDDPPQPGNQRHTIVVSQSNPACRLEL